MKKLLIANRGEIARRVIRSARRRGLATVAVFSEADSGMPHVREADESVRLPGNAPTESYLSIDLVIEAAKRTGCDSVHPGYGFLSENPALAAACAAAGLVFVGPPAEAIGAMGDKLAAKEIVKAAGVPTLESVRIDTEDASLLEKQAREIGLPVLLKAAAGGGGRGMRVVADAAGVAEAAASAQREALSAFGDGTVFMERYLSGAHHVEVQVVADQLGKVAHLFERECSIQRRHQKIVEESPSPVLTQEVREAMGEAAISSARSVGYVGVGTVEFLLAYDGSFFFLEMNTRLQVEHPVTEAVTGVDLVDLQLAIAAGEVLPPRVLTAAQDGHAIEARVYAEDPTCAWMPSAGLIHTFDIPGAGLFRLDGGLRVDSGVESGCAVSTFYDPMLAKVIAWGATREEAASRLADCLARARLHGPGTNRDLLVAILRHPDFLAGRTDTGFLDRHDPAQLGASPIDEDGERRHAMAAAMAAQLRRRREAIGFAGIQSGWRNNPSQPQSSTWKGNGGDIHIQYSFGRNGAVFPGFPGLSLVSVTEGAVVFDDYGLRRTCMVKLVGDSAFVDSISGSSVLTEVPRFPDGTHHHAPGSLLSPMPGSVVRVEVAEGQRVARGDTLVVLEAMKMEHTLSAPFDGMVTEVRARPGDQVDASVVLVVVEEDGD